LPLLAGVVLLVGCAHSQPETVAAPEAAAIRQTLLHAMEGSAAAWNRADLDGHVALYTDSAAMMTRNGPLVGKQRIRGILERGFWKEGRPAQELAFSDLAVTPLGPSHAMVTGKCILTGGGQPEFTCRFTTIWEKRPEGWRIIHDHSS
ncbi:MAG TPA: nuclear transport factor 2 family protein, partial [Gemmatimonadales bacterium]|nr:nuclear transport factor 2 family protein [Gemmatimonadales bacterium]